MAPRIHLDRTLAAGEAFDLPSNAARHVQVLRLQPGDALTLFNGADGADWPGEIVSIGRREVEVRLGAAVLVDRELAVDVTIALGVPANDRMDALVEKAGELGAAAIQPLACERSVVRLSGDRAEARRAHWQGVAAAASEQCGRARVTEVLPVRSLTSWLGALQATSAGRRIVLSLAPAVLSPEPALFGALEPARLPMRESILVLSGPEGGLTPAEEGVAVARGFVRVGLGPRVLRADTAPLALLAWLGLRSGRV